MKRLIVAFISMAACSRQGSTDATKTEVEGATKVATEVKGETKAEVEREIKAEVERETKVEVVTPEPPPAAADPCSAAALGLGAAKQAPPWEPPATCNYKGPATWIASDDDARTAFGCDGAALGIDFKREAIFVWSGSMSPAQTGSYPFDDGAKVTLITRLRDPCPDDPRPMPTPTLTFMFRMPAGPRTFDNASCTTVPQCP